VNKQKQKRAGIFPGPFLFADKENEGKEILSLLMPRKSGKKDALRKEKALLHNFVAGQKYGVWRDATRRYSGLVLLCIKKAPPETAGPWLSWS